MIYESAEKTRLEAEEKAKQKAAKEKAEREIAEKVAREKAERQAAIKAAITKLLSNATPFLRVIGILGIIVVLFWAGSWAIPKFISLVPTAKATTTQSPVVKITATNSPVIPTKTLLPNSTPTKTRTPAPTITLRVTKTPIPSPTLTSTPAKSGDYQISIPIDLEASGVIYATGIINYKGGVIWITDTRVDKGFICIKLSDIPSNAVITSAKYSYGMELAYSGSVEKDILKVESVDIEADLDSSDFSLPSYGTPLFEL
jgi:hypothetical protein